MGILGLGHVGRAVARRAEGFGMRIAYCDRHPVAGAAYRFQPDLEQLAKDSDFLVVAASGGPATRGLVSRPVLNALGSAGVLINVARGSIVDEPALVAALAERRLAGQVWTYLRTSRTFRGRFGTWTMSCSSRIRGARRSRRAGPWPTSSSSILRLILLDENR